jgi:hypothetical protein
MERPGLRELQKLLAAPTPIVAARAERRHRVERALDHVVVALAAGDLPLGDWERRCVLLAFEAMRDGLYDIAMFHVQSVLVAEEQRTRRGNMSNVTALDIEEIREIFELTRNWPA